MDDKIKIVAICGSPREGNTLEILKQLRQSNSQIEFKIIMLAKLELNDCFGCYTCFNKGEVNCPLKDDRDLIIDAMKDADGTIFASPTYARTISALMKKFVERVSFISHRPIFFGKYAMALATCSGFGADLTCKYLKENFTQSGFSFVPSVELMVATKSDKETAYNKKQALAGYQKLIRAIESEKKVLPSLGQLVYFNIFKSISEFNKLKGWADYQFYKDKKDFYYEVKIPRVKNKIAKWIAAREVRKFMANK